MNLFVVMGGAAVVLLIVLFLTQIFVPIISGRPLFPWFRTERALRNRLEEIEQEKVERALRQRVTDGEKHLNQ